MVSPAEGYEIVEGDGFLTSVREIVGFVPRWDEIRWGLDWALNRNPTDPSFATHLAGDLWITEPTGHFDLAVLYAVDEQNRRVTYVSLNRIP